MEMSLDRYKNTKPWPPDRYIICGRWSAESNMHLDQSNNFFKKDINHPFLVHMSILVAYCQLFITAPADVAAH